MYFCYGRRAIRSPSLYCNLAKPHPLGVYIVYERSSHVFSFVSLYFAVVKLFTVTELRLTYQYSCNSASDLLVLLSATSNVPNKVFAVSYIFTLVTVSN